MLKLDILLVELKVNVLVSLLASRLGLLLAEV